MQELGIIPRFFLFAFNARVYVPQVLVSRPGIETWYTNVNLALLPSINKTASNRELDRKNSSLRHKGSIVGRYLINDELVLEENIDLGIVGSPSFIGLNSVGISKPLVA